MEQVTIRTESVDIVAWQEHDGSVWACWKDADTASGMRLQRVKWSSKGCYVLSHGRRWYFLDV